MDLSINGPGSPTSLQKFVDNHELRPMTILVDGTGLGIAKDDPDFLYISPSTCVMQCDYYVSTLFNGVNIPAYLYRYLDYMMNMDNNPVLIKSDKELVEHFLKNNITETSPEYQHILNLIKYSASNTEVQHLIGFIQLVAGSLSAARKQKASIKLYLEHPETALHPKRQARLMSLIVHLQNEYEIVDLTGIIKKTLNNDL